MKIISINKNIYFFFQIVFHLGKSNVKNQKTTINIQTKKVVNSKKNLRKKSKQNQKKNQKKKNSNLFIHFTTKYFTN
jgi:hypothetical protein